MMLSNSFKIFGVSLAIAVLTACGGGRDDPLPTDSSADPVAKYAGSWISECFEDSGASAQARADFTKTSATNMTGDVIAYAFIGRSCSGPSVKKKEVLTDLNVKFIGTTTTQGREADKFEGTSAKSNGKVLLWTDGTTLQVGDPKSPDDAEGFPSTFRKETLTRLK